MGSICVQILQHPVGQGGFLTGCLDIRRSQPFKWVYDCGSNQNHRLKYEIDQRYGESEFIDVLFLSHLDDTRVPFEQGNYRSRAHKLCWRCFEGKGSTVSGVSINLQ